MRDEIRAAPGSFRDPSGFVFFSEGEPLRQVNRIYQEHYDCLMASGLYRELTSRQALVPHEEETCGFPGGDQAYKVLRPERIPFLSHPFEWCFSQWRDAALLTLEIEERALAHGMSLKDATAYNIQFHKGRPVLIDTLSFEVYREGIPWIAYRQFCQHFLAPLALMAKTDPRLGGLARIHMDGIPLDLADTLLPFGTRFSPGLLLHIHLHARSQRAFAKPANPGWKAAGERRGPAAPGAGRLRMGKSERIELVGSLKRTVERLTWKTRASEWSGYYRENSYDEVSMAGKREIILEMLEQVGPRTLWDLGSNTGEFSRIAAGLGIETVAFDLDHAAVEENYRRCQKDQIGNLLPLVMDLANPTPDFGWANSERASLLERGPVDACLALALIHHLALGHNLPLGRISEWFAQLGRFMIVEFVPKSDEQVIRLLASREDVFPDYGEEGFKAAFSRDFKFLDRRPIPGSDRAIYLLEADPL